MIKCIFEKYDYFVFCQGFAPYREPLKIIKNIFPIIQKKYKFSSGNENCINLVYDLIQAGYKPFDIYEDPVFKNLENLLQQIQQDTDLKKDLKHLIKLRNIAVIMFDEDLKEIYDDNYQEEYFLPKPSEIKKLNL